MFNKFKRAVTYICKKIKQGVKIMAEVGKDIVNTVGCKAVDRIADHADKKLEMVERAGSALCNGAKGAGKTSKSTIKEVFSGIGHFMNDTESLKTYGSMFIFVGAGMLVNGIIKSKGEK